MIHAICFDLDNTLVDRDAAFARYCRVFCRRHLAWCARDQRRRAERQMIAFDAQGTCSRDAWSQWMLAKFPQARLEAQAIWDERRAAITRWLEPDATVLPLLDHLRARYPLALISNGSSQSQRGKLHKLSLESRFEQVWISEEFGYEKPAPKIFRAALAALGASAAETLFVGDDPLRDMVGARQVGMRTCWLRRGRVYPPAWPAPDYQLTRLAELESLLAC